MLLKPESKAMLTKVLTYHVVSGRLSVDELKKQIKRGGGTATLKTVSGGMLWAMMDAKDIVLKDEKGEVSRGSRGTAGANRRPPAEVCTRSPGTPARTHTLYSHEP
jgi:hypothetical protein